MRGKRFWGTALVSAVLALSASAEIYRWTDAHGVVHYTSDIQQVPAGQRDLARAAVRTGKGSLQRIETPPGSAPRSADAAPSGRLGAAPPAALAGDEAIAGKTEKEWREEMTRLRSRVALYRPAAERCEDERFQWSPGDGGRRYREEQAEAEACDETRRNFELAVQLALDFEESAHRAGVPPGWVRE